MPTHSFDEEHLTLLKEGVEAWNKWRRENLEMRLDLRGADLLFVDLRGADLRGADLSEAHLLGADLRAANLSGAHLNGAHLTEAKSISSTI